MGVRVGVDVAKRVAVDVAVEVGALVAVGAGVFVEVGGGAVVEVGGGGVVDVAVGTAVAPGACVADGTVDVATPIGPLVPDGSAVAVATVVGEGDAAGVRVGVFVAPPLTWVAVGEAAGDALLSPPPAKTMQIPVAAAATIAMIPSPAIFIQPPPLPGCGWGAPATCSPQLLQKWAPSGMCAPQPVQKPPAGWVTG